jgi:hypothetical protein
MPNLCCGSERYTAPCSCPEGTPPDVRRLAEWWATQPPQLLTIKQVLTAEESPLNSSFRCWHCPAVALEDESLKEAPQEV